MILYILAVDENSFPHNPFACKFSLISSFLSSPSLLLLFHNSFFVDKSIERSSVVYYRWRLLSRGRSRTDGQPSPQRVRGLPEAQRLEQSHRGDILSLDETEGLAGVVAFLEQLGDHELHRDAAQSLPSVGLLGLQHAQGSVVVGHAPGHQLPRLLILQSDCPSLRNDPPHLHE